MTDNKSPMSPTDLFRLPDFRDGWSGQMKVDGWRLVLECRDRDVRAFGKKGQEWTDWVGLRGILDWFRAARFGECRLDMELLSYNPVIGDFRKGYNAGLRNGTEYTPFLFIIDTMTPGLPQVARWEEVLGLLSGGCHPNVRFLIPHLVEDIEDVNELLTQAFSWRAGPGEAQIPCDGIVLKRHDGLYVMGHEDIFITPDWINVRKFISPHE